MPRGKSIPNKSVDQQMAELDERIGRLQNRLSELKNKRLSLLHEKEKKDMTMLVTFIKESGLSPSELMSQQNKKDRSQHKAF